MMSPGSRHAAARCRPSRRATGARFRRLAGWRSKCRAAPVGWRADGAAPDRRRRPTSPLRPRHADRRRPRPRPGGPVLRLAGRRRRRGPAGAERDGAGHGVARGPTERLDGLAQGLRRAGFRLLHQLHLSQGPGARRQPPQRTAVPVAPDATAGNRDRDRRPGERRRDSGLLPHPSVRLAARGLGQSAVGGHRRPRRAGRGDGAAARDVPGRQQRAGARVLGWPAAPTGDCRVLVGEQPGDVEDQRGEPFVGPAGRLLHRALAEVGLPAESTYTTNAVKHFKFTSAGGGKRRIHATPDAYEVTACRPWLVAELALLDPELVVVLGATAARALLGPAFRVTRSRGTLMPWPASAARPEDFGAGEDGARRAAFALATIHPSAVLRAQDQDEAYAGFVADLRTGAQALAG